jgi:hypothetical protein
MNPILILGPFTAQTTETFAMGQIAMIPALLSLTKLPQVEGKDYLTYFSTLRIHFEDYHNFNTSYTANKNKLLKMIREFLEAKFLESVKVEELLGPVTILPDWNVQSIEPVIEIHPNITITQIDMNHLLTQFVNDIRKNGINSPNKVYVPTFRVDSTSNVHWFVYFALIMNTLVVFFSSTYGFRWVFNLLRFTFQPAEYDRRLFPGVGVTKAIPKNSPLLDKDDLEPIIRTKPITSRLPTAYFSANEFTEYPSITAKTQLPTWLWTSPQFSTFLKPTRKTLGHYIQVGCMLVLIWHSVQTLYLGGLQFLLNFFGVRSNFYRTDFLITLFCTGSINTLHFIIRRVIFSYTSTHPWWKRDLIDARLFFTPICILWYLFHYSIAWLRSLLGV